MSAADYASTGPSRVRADLLRIYVAAVSAVEPRRLIARALDGEIDGGEDVSSMVADASGIYLLAVGKAAAGMAAEAQSRVGPKLKEGLIIVPGGGATAAPDHGGSTTVADFVVDLGNFRVLPASHPIPDASSEAAGWAALEMVSHAKAGDLLLMLLSGGASALMVAPAGSIKLADKVAVTSALMRAGATIRELNTVRKHLSTAKGGRLLRALAPGVRVLTLILSDVPGNDLATIGSGPTAADPTIYSDAIAVMKRRGLWGRAPESVRDHLERGAAGEFDETLKPGDPVMARVKNLIVGDNGAAIAAAVETAIALGYAVERGRKLNGEANDVGRTLAAHLATIERERVCVIAGGEPVVTVKGSGRGGRAQQCALAMALELARIAAGRRIAAIFAGTDGVDGPTDAAGAIVTPLTVGRGSEAGLDAQAALERNDSYTFFKALGDLVIIGPTGTNVADIFVGLVNY
jgi:hydroxypyruvate reductase